MTGEDAFALVDEAVMLLGASALVVLAVIGFQIKTGNPNLDRLTLRGRIALQSLLVFKWRALENGFAIPRALVAIVNNETKGAPAPQVGDTGIASGPSIGPGQVLRQTAIDLGLVATGISQADYQALAADEGKCVEWMVKVFSAKLDAAPDLPSAIQAYNGTGDAAATYKDNALAFFAANGWGTP